MTADDLYGTALALLGESRERAKGYDDKLLPLVNLSLLQLYPAEQALRRARALPLLSAPVQVQAREQPIDGQPDLLAACLPYGLAAALVLDDDAARANYFGSMADSALQAYTPADFVPIADWTGGMGDG